MNAQDSLLDNFTSMQEEFSSSNNRIIREVGRIFDNSLDDLLMSLKYLNEEYVIVDIRDLQKDFEFLSLKVKEAWENHVFKYIKNFNKEQELLKQEMYLFFKEKLIKGSDCKRKMSCYIKHSLDKMCDFNIIGLEEDVENAFYDFKVNFELKYINDEYCKDDFNKIMRTCRHSLMEEVRDKAIHTVSDMQEIVSRYAEKGYNIVDHYKAIGRK